MKTCLCGNPLNTPGARRCLECGRASAKAWREAHPLTPEQRRRASARSSVHVYLKRGTLRRKPCEVCGLTDVEAHHDDYSKPRAVRWLCHEHHLAHHATQRAKRVPTCTKCSKPLARFGQGYCPACHLAYMREYRKHHPATPTTKARNSARAYVRVYIQRGKLTPGPCEVCGSEQVTVHHDEPSKPLEVRWFCREHRLRKPGKPPRD